MRSRWFNWRIGTAAVAGLLGPMLSAPGAEAAVAGSAALVAAPALLGMGWLVGLAIFPPAALLAIAFVIVLTTDRMA